MSYLVRVWQGLCAQPGPCSSNGSKMFPHCKTPPRAHFQTSLQHLPVDTPGKAALVAHAVSQGHGALAFFSTGYSSNKKISKTGALLVVLFFLFFHLGEYIKKLNPCRNTCLIKKTSVLEKVLRSAASCRACGTAGHLGGSQPGSRAGNCVWSRAEGCIRAALRTHTHALSCTVAIIAESHNVRRYGLSGFYTHCTAGGEQTHIFCWWPKPRQLGWRFFRITMVLNWLINTLREFRL